MSNEYFQFRKFIVYQERCAMKVGTDGTLLGAWASVPIESGRVLDVGTGTGLVSLMIAQRFSQALITAIDINSEAVEQASENVLGSPFSNRIIVKKADLKTYDDCDGFDAVVCNPPFFVNSLISPNTQRTMARHTISLTHSELISGAYRLLKKDGLFSVIIPAECKDSFLEESCLVGFFVKREFGLRTTPRKPIKRYLLEFSKIPEFELIKDEKVIEVEPGFRSEWYQQLTQDFYLH